MGCSSSKEGSSKFTTSNSKGEMRGARESSSSSPSPVEFHKKPTAAAQPRWKVDALQCEQLSKDWVKAFEITDGGEKATVEMVLKDSMSLLKSWPRGELAGQLLAKPIPSDVPLKERGVKLTWFMGAWRHMTSNTNRHLISTRMFVELFVRPMLLAEGQGNDPSLFEFIPLEFRSAPTVYVCHPWDGYLKHILFFPDNLKRSWPADPALWVDFIACTQLDDGPNPERLPEIKDTVQSIARTVVVFPGDGAPSFAVLPATRSWCVYEMLCTPKDQMDFRVGLHGDLNDIDFHSKIVQLIDSLSVERARATFESDKRAIDATLLANGEVQNTNALRAITRAAFAKRYENVPTTPSMNNRISGGSQRSRINSMSDIYANDEIQLEDGKSPNPDF